MKLSYGSLAAAFTGAATVSIAFWLLESVVPQVWFVPFEASTLTILLAILVAGAVVARRGRVFEAAALLAGSGAAWAIHEVQPLNLCQSDLLYRPCTTTEIGAMALPAVVLLVVAAGLLASALLRRLSR